MKGLKQLSRRLKAIPVKARQAAEKSILKSADELADMQRRLSPVDDGDLRESITVTPPGATTPPYSQPGGSKTAGPLQAIVTAGNSKVRYAHLVEFGAAPHIAGGIFAGAQHPGAPAQPFFWPSYRVLRKRIKNRTSRTIRKAIRDEFKK